MLSRPVVPARYTVTSHLPLLLVVVQSDSDVRSSIHTSHKTLALPGTFNFFLQRGVLSPHSLTKMWAPSRRVLTIL